MAAGAPRPTRQLRVSQAAFDSAVAENVEEFGMAPDEAARDAAAAFALQGVDLAGICTTPNGAAAPASGDELGEATARLEVAVGQLAEAGERDGGGGSGAVSSVAAAVEALGFVVTSSGSFHLTPDGGRRAVRAAISACSKLHQLDVQSLLKASLQLLPPLLAAGDDVRDSFGIAAGAEVVVQCLHGPAPLAGAAAAAAAAAAAGSETNKDALMGASAHVALLDATGAEDPAVVLAACHALRRLATADDHRPPSSNAYGNARVMAKAGAVATILGTMARPGIPPAALVALCQALDSIAVNDEICREVAQAGGIRRLLDHLGHAEHVHETALAQTTAALLGQLAGSDANKEQMAWSEGALESFLSAMVSFSDDPIILQECMAAIACLCLRSPENAAKAVRLGAIEVAAEAMEAHPSAGPMQRQACNLFRNLAVRNPENRPLILERGLEDLIRAAKRNHKQACKDAGAAALRDLGLDDYNA
eukprot:SM000043S15795  [mRNA]  locus=s43:249986:253148:+ [translate_table: standard]